MDLEVEELKSQLSNSSVTVKANMEFHEGVLSSTNVVIVRCGVGKVNAALCVQILADMFQVSHIINTGVAGSLNAALNIGDILVSTQAIYHDVDATVWGYQPGEVPQMGIREFPADRHLIELSLQICKQINPDIHAQSGRIVSGDQFISDRAVKQRLIDVFHGDCAEMEGAAIAHGAYLNQIPFVIIRAISDKADDSAQVEYPVFEKAAARHSARLVSVLVDQI